MYVFQICHGLYFKSLLLIIKNMQKQSDASKLALAATRSPDLMPLRRIMNKRARIMMEDCMKGISLPQNPPERRRFLEGVGGISQKTTGKQADELIEMCRRRIRGLALNKQLEALKGEVLHMRRIIKVANSSSIGPDYSKYLGRPDFDIDVFLHSIALFGKGRAVEFSQVSERIRKIRRDFLKELKRKNADGIIDILRKNLSEAKEDPAVAYEVFALLGDDFELAKALLAKAEPKRYYEMKKCLEQEDFEGAGVLFMEEVDVDAKCDVLRSLTDIGIYANPYNAELVQFNESFSADGIDGFIASNGKDLYKSESEGISSENELIVATRSAIQHELQHIFDNISLCEAEFGPEEEREYRAYLGELAFSDERIKLCAWFMNGVGKEPEDNGHYPARKRIGRLMIEENLNDSNAIIRFAMDLLNEAYKQACGLTYDQIIEPFKSICSKKRAKALDEKKLIKKV